MFPLHHYQLFLFRYVWLFLFLAIAKPVFQQETKLEAIDYSNLSSDSILQISRNYLMRSLPDKGIPLLFGLLDTLDSNSDNSHLARIFIAEGYREKKEHKKGCTIISEVLRNENLSAKNKAFAYNRMAALYGDLRGLAINSGDTIIKYSELSLQISRKYGYEEYIASSLNELGYVYLLLNKYEKSKDLFLEAYMKFEVLGMNLNAMTTAVNLAKVYRKLKEYKSAIQILEEAMHLEDLKGNENIFMRLNLTLAEVFEAKMEFESAYLYLSKARKLQQSFYVGRLNVTVSEMVAKYDLQIQKSLLKEEELKKDNALKNKAYWILASSFLLVLLIAIGLPLDF